MRSQRMLLLGSVLLGMGAGLWGCSSSETKDDKGTLNTTAPVNNSAPEAKGAPAAPTDPSIISPGAMKKKGMAAPK
jgi:hypothetical protein